MTERYLLGGTNANRWLPRIRTNAELEAEGILIDEDAGKVGEAGTGTQGAQTEQEENLLYNVSREVFAFNPLTREEKLLLQTSREFTDFATDGSAVYGLRRIWEDRGKKGKTEVINLETGRTEFEFPPECNGLTKDRMGNIYLLETTYRKGEGDVYSYVNLKTGEKIPCEDLTTSCSVQHRLKRGEPHLIINAGGVTIFSTPIGFNTFDFADNELYVVINRRLQGKKRFTEIYTGADSNREPILRRRGWIIGFASVPKTLIERIK